MLRRVKLLVVILAITLVHQLKSYGILYLQSIVSVLSVTPTSGQLIRMFFPVRVIGLWVKKRVKLAILKGLIAPSGNEYRVWLGKL